jgi:hypothetical protein
MDLGAEIGGMRQLPSPVLSMCTYQRVLEIVAGGFDSIEWVPYQAFCRCPVAVSAGAPPHHRNRPMWTKTPSIGTITAGSQRRR